MPLEITTQKVDTWKKRIQRTGLKGSTYFCQERSRIRISASADHQDICRQVLGPPNKDIKLKGYISWADVSAHDLVELIYQINIFKKS